ncbi:uncharacterized protein DNG_08386 [Cephalotrichum gorgonifer]|uniref:Uncharacterized protein n=1 Tax=Cephalotrichum gorgonifer TaxID=2041049 RepID=A0AAE8SYC2_9PEZI|nr:uncharacterized protein DNG_08386 [Cephalotrichum gorgonifer]
MVLFESSFADSPVLTIAPRTAHQAITLGKTTAPPTAAPMRPRAFLHRRPVTMTNSRPSGAGRKRSRDEAEPNLSESDEAAPPALNPWMSGNDTMMLEPETTVSSSQAGTLSAAEAMRNSEIKTAMQMQQDQQLSGRSHKTQRRDQAVPAVTASPRLVSTGPSSHSEPADVVVDDFTLHLGIGWRRISNDEHIQAAARGWARFIENHYPISNVVIRLESKGLQSYLVESSQGYFLFDENLRCGRLVSSTDEGALHNLKSNPPVFEGPETMMAAAQSSITSYGQVNNTRLFGALDMEMEVC